MKILNHSTGRWVTRLVIAAITASTVSSCVVARGPHRHAVVVAPAPIRVLPVGARPTIIRGERCWVHRGTYYRRHTSGYVVFVP
jgi:hypothetical protein